MNRRYHIEFKTTTGGWFQSDTGYVFLEGATYKTAHLTRDQAIEAATRIPRAGPRSIRIRPGAC